MSENKRTVQKDEVCYDARDGGQIIRVVGVSFRKGYPDNLLRLHENYPNGELIPVKLEREPENPHDSGAIKVCIGDDHIGYIPKVLNPPIAEAMDRGVNYVARVEEVLVTPKKPRQPGILIHIKDPLQTPALVAPSE